MRLGRECEEVEERYYCMKVYQIMTQSAYVVDNDNWIVIIESIEYRSISGAESLLSFQGHGHIIVIVITIVISFSSIYLIHDEYSFAPLSLSLSVELPLHLLRI